MISVCMATYNGQKYIKEQIDSILCQLGNNDELVISDDNSSDNTVDIIHSYNDKRIKFFYNSLQKGVTHNFENALQKSKGDIIFLADQDDVWLPGKLEKMTRYMTEGNYDVVECSCSLTDEKLNIIKQNYYSKKFPQIKSVWGNFVKNSWLGCCMAFKRYVFEAASPFPDRASSHDLWLCLFMQLHYKCGYMSEPMQLYRRHSKTVSFAGGKSTNSLWFRLSTRAYIAWHLIIRSIKHRLRLREQLNKDAN